MTGQYCFSDFVLDFEARELRRGVESISLSPKAYQLLQILVCERPKALSKMELQDRLWPDTFVVEKNLVNLVAEIRAALGDDATYPRFVKTVPRFGYAFREAAAPIAAPDRTRDTNVRVRLRWADGRAALREGQHLLGRDPELDLFIDSPSVSRRHALIRVSATNVTIEDLGSKNGTFVADRPASAPTTLAHGDVIRLGSVEVTFSVAGGQRSTRTAVPRTR
jgi:DNA-binding winged helix-turn-helix (wHTH) protein